MAFNKAAQTIQSKEDAMKHFYIILLAVIIGVVGITAFIMHNNNDDSFAAPDGSAANSIEDQEFDDEDYDNGIEFEEEAEGAELHFKPVEQDQFFGEWVATSGQSLYMYGEVEINIKPTGGWSGNIADEEVSGKWEYKNGSLLLTSDLFEATLSFTNDDKLIMQEQRDEDDEALLNTVLSRKE